MIHIPAYYQSLDLIPNLELMRLLKEEINWIQRRAKEAIESYMKTKKSN